jgi:hypothetical protein
MTGRAEMLGKKFGKLTPVKVLKEKKLHLLYRCVCDCGNEIEAMGNSLRSGNTKSCGCIRKPNLVGLENNHCIVINKVRNRVWTIKCKHCGEEHIQNQREIKNNAHSMACSKYKPYNWSGLEREDNIMRKQYGISTQQFEELLEFQGSGCAICAKPIENIRRRMNIDHDHKSDIVRGILCTGCNTGLGHLGDDIEGLKRALYYLENTPYNEYSKLDK